MKFDRGVHESTKDDEMQKLNNMWLRGSGEFEMDFILNKDEEGELICNHTTEELSRQMGR